MERLEVQKLKQGDVIRARIGPWKGHVLTVFSVNFDGAWNGWVRCLTPEGRTLLFAGEELEEVNK